MHKQPLKFFISCNKEEIDEYIFEKDPSIKNITNEVREDWLRNNERLNIWAVYEGVNFKSK
jgi:hypothetical protein